MTNRAPITAVFLFIALLASAPSPAAEIELKTPDGGSVQAVIAGPKDAKAGILMLHDWFGVTDMTREAVEKLGKMGYRVLAVDLYKGKAASTHPEAQALMGELGGRDKDEVNAILQAGLDALKVPGRKIATFGFSMGGAIALRAHLLEPSAVSASVVVYGGGLANRPAEDYRKLNGPVLMISGAKDQWAMDSVRAMMDKMKEAEKDAEIYIYPGADHGFAQPLWAEGSTLDPTATRVSWMVIEDFLERNLG